jgi:iron complex outermembrane receptor protein
MVNGAVRFENYSDFGNTFYKLATQIAPNFNLRVVATGFSAILTPNLF